MIKFLRVVIFVEFNGGEILFKSLNIFLLVEIFFDKCVIFII